MQSKVYFFQNSFFPSIINEYSNYSQFRKLEYLQENTFEFHVSLWRHCF